jgi:RNA polymerase sigma-70 factor (ECF subfamily)
MSTKTSDGQLIDAVIRGDQAAYRSLIDRYQKYVFTITYNILKNREEAEEAAQDVFIKVYKKLRSFERKSKFSTWLYTIAYRTGLDYQKKKKYHTRSIDSEESYLQIEDTKSKNPDQSMHQADLKEKLKAAIEQLKPADASVITLFYLHEKSVQEVAQIMDLTVSNVKTKLHRLREALRQQLEQQLKTEIQDLL